MIALRAQIGLAAIAVAAAVVTWLVRPVEHVVLPIFVPDLQPRPVATMPDALVWVRHELADRAGACDAGDGRDEIELAYAVVVEGGVLRLDDVSVGTHTADYRAEACVLAMACEVTRGIDLPHQRVVDITVLHLHEAWLRTHVELPAPLVATLATFDHYTEPPRPPSAALHAGALWDSCGFNGTSQTPWFELRARVDIAAGVAHVAHVDLGRPPSVPGCLADRLRKRTTHLTGATLPAGGLPDGSIYVRFAVPPSGPDDRPAAVERYGYRARPAVMDGYYLYAWRNDR
jgi:hypothetical protein